MAFVMNQKVLFKHCDPAGVVFYPRYFEMINDCVEAFFDDIGTPFETLHKDAGVPTVHIDTTFHATSRHGDHLVIALQVIRVGTTSLTLSVTASCGSELRFSAEPTLVHINASGRPEKWPDTIRNPLTKHLRSTS